MAGNVLIYIFVALFFLFLVESIYFLKKKLTIGPKDALNDRGNQSGGKLILIGGLAIVILFTTSFVYLFLVKQQTSPSSTISQRTTPTTFPTQPEVSPTAGELAYSYPTVTEIPTSPTAALTLKVSPTQKIAPTKTTILTKTPTPTAKPKVPPSTTTPTNIPPIGGPDSASPTSNQLSQSTEVIVPKLPVAGSAGQTLILAFIAIFSILVGLIL